MLLSFCPPSFPWQYSITSKLTFFPGCFTYAGNPRSLEVRMLEQELQIQISITAQTSSRGQPAHGRQQLFLAQQQPVAGMWVLYIQVPSGCFCFQIVYFNAGNRRYFKNNGSEEKPRSASYPYHRGFVLKSMEAKLCFRFKQSC